MRIVDDMGLRDTIRDQLDTSPIVVGSVDLDLMTWPDIDLYVEYPEEGRAQFLSLGPRVASQLDAQRCPVVRLSYRDEYRQITQPIGEGMYWGFRFHHPRAPFQSVLSPADRQWKLDLWAWSRREYAERVRQYEELKSELSTVERATVLNLKDAVCRRPDYRKEITSADVYEFVLNFRSTDVTAFDAWITQ